MADMRDFMYRQKVSEDELDGAFGALETADKKAIVDLDFASRDDPDPSAKADYGGIMWGWDMVILGGLEVTLAAGAGYDESGNRVGTGESVVLDVTKDGYTSIGQGGQASGSVIDPGVGNEVWVSVLITFDRALSDARYDGYNNLVYHKRDESFKFRYKKSGTTGAIGTNPSRAARESNEILIEDVLVQNSGGTLSISGIAGIGGVPYNTYDRRREFYFDYTGANTPLSPLTSNPIEVKSKYNNRDSMVAIIELLNDHIGGHANQHPGLHLPWVSGGRVWADGLGGNMALATTVTDAIWGIIDDLNATQPVGVARPGASSIGLRAVNGALQAPDYTTVHNITQQDLQSELEGMLGALNGRVFRGGDLSIGPLAPATNGEDLGIEGGNRWDFFGRDLDLNGAVSSHLIPALTNTKDLGNGTEKWRNAYFSGGVDCSGTSYFRAYTELSGASAHLRILSTAIGFRNDAVSDLYGDVYVKAGASFEIEDDLSSIGNLKGTLAIAPGQNTMGGGGPAIYTDSTYKAIGGTGSTIDHMSGFWRRIAKRQGQAAGVGGAVTYEIDNFGFEEWGQGSKHNCLSPEKLSSYSSAQFEAEFTPWGFNVPAGSPNIFANKTGYNNRPGLGLDVDGIGDFLQLRHGSVVSGPPSYTIGDRPAFYFVFINPSALGNFNKGKVDIGFRNHTSSPSREVRLRFNGQSGGAIEFTYYDGGVPGTTTDVVSASPAQDNTVYICRIFIMSTNLFIAQVSALGTGSLVHQSVISYGGGSPYLDSHGCFAFIEASNGGTAGGPYLVFHRLQVGTTINYDVW